MGDLGRTPKVVVGQPFAAIGGDLGSDPYIMMRGRFCPTLFKVTQGPLSALLVQVPPNASNGMNPVRAHRADGRGTWYLPLYVRRLGLVVNADNSSMTRFDAVHCQKYKTDLSIPAGHVISDIIISHDGLFILGSDPDNDSFIIWPVVDLPLDLVDKVGSLGQVSFPIVLDIRSLPGADALPPVELQPRGLAISNDGNFLACALSNLAVVIVVDISLVNNLPAIIQNNDLDNESNFGVSLINLELTDRPTRLAFSPSGKYILTSNYNTHSVSVINNEGENAVLIGTVNLAPYGRNPQEIDFVMDNATGHEIAYTVLSLPSAGSGPGTVVFFDIDAYAAAPGIQPAVAQIGAGNMPVGIAIDTNYKYAVVSNFDDDNSIVLDLSTNTVLLDKIPSPGGPTTVERYNAENIFYIANRLDNSISLFKLDENGKPRKIRILSGLSQPGSIAIQQNP
jgi:hypothetical protein